MGVPGPTARIEWVAFQSGDYDAMAQIQAFGSCGWSGVGKSARLLTAIVMTQSATDQVEP
jgi:hypothetical protein